VHPAFLTTTAGCPNESDLRPVLDPFSAPVDLGDDDARLSSQMRYELETAFAWGRDVEATRRGTEGIAEDGARFRGAESGPMR